MDARLKVSALIHDTAGKNCEHDLDITTHTITVEGSLADVEVSLAEVRLLLPLGPFAI